MPLAAEPVHLPRLIAWPVLPVLVIVLAASSIMFRLLVVRWTTRKHWLDLSRWAEDHAMTLAGPEAGQLPEPLTGLGGGQVDACLGARNGTSIVSFRTAHAPAHAHATDAARAAQWHVLVRPLPGGASWPPTALRPRANATSLVDLLGNMTSFPSIAPPERFVIFGTESAAARRVAKSSLLALCPPDLGLILYGSHLLLDFSARPFDGIELSRVSALVDQLATHLPSPPA